MLEKPSDASSCATVSSDRKSTRLNSSHTIISYAVFCLKKKKKKVLSVTHLDGVHAAQRAQREKLVCFTHVTRVLSFSWVRVRAFFSFSLFFFFLIIGPPPNSTLFPSPPFFR